MDITGQKAITALKKYFGQNELMKNVRNHYAFHYSPEQISAALADLEEPIDLKIYLSEQSGNTYFQISETIVNTAMLDSIEKGDYETALRKLMEHVLTVSQDFVKFFDAWLSFVLQEYYPEITSPDKMEKLKLSDLPKVEAIGFDYFISEEQG